MSSKLPAASQRTLAIPELLERVVGHVLEPRSPVTAKQLKTCRLVSKLWRNTVDAVALHRVIICDRGWHNALYTKVDLDTNPEQARHIRVVAFDYHYYPDLSMPRRAAELARLEKDCRWLSRCKQAQRLSVGSIVLLRLFDSLVGRGPLAGSMKNLEFSRLTHLSLRGGSATPHFMTFVKGLTSVNDLRLVQSHPEQPFDAFCAFVATIVKCLDKSITALSLEWGWEILEFVTPDMVEELGIILGSLKLLDFLHLASPKDFSVLLKPSHLPKHVSYLRLDAHGQTLNAAFRVLTKKRLFDKLKSPPSLKEHDRAGALPMMGRDDIVEKATVEAAISAYEKRTASVVSIERRKQWLACVETCYCPSPADYDGLHPRKASLVAMMGIHPRHLGAYLGF